VPAEVVAGMRHAPMWPDFEAVAHTLAYDAELMDGLLDGGAPPAQRWAAVTVPTLVADGGASPSSFAVAADVLAGVLLDARRITLPDQEHAVDPAYWPRCWWSSTRRESGGDRPAGRGGRLRRATRGRRGRRPR
jgi:hypothetical protein